MRAKTRDGRETVVPPMDAAEITAALDVVRRADPVRIEQTGEWYWADFAEKPDEETRAAMSAAGWRWAREKGRWYLPTVRSGKGRPKHMSAIRDKYGSEILPTEDRDPAPASAGLFS